VVPILNLEKPTTLTVTLAKGIPSTLYHRKKINWGFLLHRNAKQMATSLGSKKGCALAPFLYHLYEKHGCITEQEKKRLEIPLISGDRSPAKKKATHPGEARNRPRHAPQPVEREMAHSVGRERPKMPQLDRGSIREERRKEREDMAREQSGGARPQREER
jgi:hypothetical protein